MARTCRKCESRIRSGRLCKDCYLDKRYGQGIGDDDQESDDEQDRDMLEYECTSCGNEYEATGLSPCPECGGHTCRCHGKVGGAA